jgi:hypothetical protein
MIFKCAFAKIACAKVTLKYTVEHAKKGNIMSESRVALGVIVGVFLAISAIRALFLLGA